MNAKPLYYIALGDSITAGKGVPEGAAYPSVLFRHLRHSSECRLENLAISGLTSGELLTLVRNRFAQRLAPANCITLSIGGNDLLRRLITGHSNPYSYVRAVRQLWTTAAALMAEIRRHAPSARVFVLGFYNPYPASWWGFRTAEWLIRRLNREYATRVAGPRVEFINLQEILPGASRGWLCDGVHPSVAGHRRIAGALFDAYRRTLPKESGSGRLIPSAYRGPRGAQPKSAS
ncbi:MAG: SGNH/GDSL hydrolase family protein [Kyrpidia tusciae]|nr:SGNH/GDSL hydrolase family protein [Kyrpidia tusciae]MBE3551414.1 SGNH/GDSL hydrolase family protein [Kyrpidia tusciae]